MCIRDRCRLWGKLQTAGYGTALKVLFEFGNDAEGGSKPLLRRTELVALINTLDKISQALKAIEEFRSMMQANIPAKTNVVLPKHEVEEKEAMHDDGLDDVDDEQCINLTQGTVKEMFLAEWSRVWHAFCYIIGSWVGLPGKM